MEKFILEKESKSLQGQKKIQDTTSQYVGVSFSKQRKKWKAYINYEGKCQTIGFYINEIHAALAYNEKALIIYGENAKLNIIEESLLESLEPLETRKKKYIGTYFDNGKWNARIYYDGKTHSLGWFESEVDAAIAYNNKALEIRGNKAKINIIRKENE